MPIQYYNPEPSNETISITGFGGEAIGLPSLIDPVKITGTFQEYARTTYSNQPVLVHAIITITEDQEISVDDKTVILVAGNTYELKGDGVGYKLINNGDYPLTVIDGRRRDPWKREDPYSKGKYVPIIRGVVTNEQHGITRRYKPYYESINNESINENVTGNRQHRYILPNNATIQSAATHTNQEVPNAEFAFAIRPPKQVHGSQYTTWNSTSREREPIYRTPKRSFLGRVGQGVRNAGSGIGKFGMGLGTKVRSLFGRGGTRKQRRSGRKRTVKKEIKKE